jgi:hypothetical protein
VGLVPTPTTTSNNHRLSGHLSLVEDDGLSPKDTPRAISQGDSLQFLASAGLTRSSYLTSSSDYRMSGLSDFPIPPTDYEERQKELEDIQDNAQQKSSWGNSPPPPDSRRMTFGGDEVTEDVAKELSSS